MEGENLVINRQTTKISRANGGAAEGRNNQRNMVSNFDLVKSLARAF